MELKVRYFWNKEMYYISGNLGIGFTEYEKKAKTSKVMLWTGLLDRRGKEIYEGDILYIPLWQLTYKPSYVFVKWEEKFKVEIITENEETVYDYVDCFIVESKNGLKISLRELIDTIHPDACVVGNIYENPKLLEVN